MLPGKLVTMEKLPYTANGEADRGLVSRLLQRIPLWRLTCTPTPDAAGICLDCIK